MVRWGSSRAARRRILLAESVAPTDDASSKDAVPATREAILQALHSLLQTQPAPVLRGDVLPERVPATGLLTLDWGARPGGAG
jgi:hypothetical protein